MHNMTNFLNDYYRRAHIFLIKSSFNLCSYVKKVPHNNYIIKHYILNKLWTS